jgi:selT/selW/selH-like putative selenoprotein
LQEAYRDVDVRMIESSGGAFEVTVDGVLVYSKLRLGRHPREGEVRSLIDTHRGEHR